MLSSFKKIFRNWAFRRSVTSGTLLLNQRRIYIVPSWLGLGFVIVLLLMLLGDINYDLSLGYALTFLLAMMAVMSMLATFRNLTQLRIRAGQITPVFAGEDAQFVFHFDNAGAPLRYQLHLHDDAANSTVFDLPAGACTAVHLAIPAIQRGWLDSGRLTLHSGFPLGLFYAWTYVHFDVRALVYPQAAPTLPLPASSAHHATGGISVAGDEDFSGLRSYVAGDSLPRIAWKALAREQGLQVKQFSAPQDGELWLDWTVLGDRSQEQKLRVLTRWVLDADAQGLHYGLRLPDGELVPQHSPAHKNACLRKLALFGLNEK